MVQCSKWGHKLVDDRDVKAQFLVAVLPVLTAPEIVHQAVAGILGGKINLSAANIEPILVLANAVGVSKVIICNNIDL